MKTASLNLKNIFNLLEKNNNAKFLDLGCGDGNRTMKLSKAIGTINIYGVEIVDEKIKIAKENGIKVKKFDLNNRFNFEDNFFDIILSNQVIEHLYNSDNFLSEIHRVLKPCGYAVISTENASSWDNIFASILGWQIFSLTNFSNKTKSIGNPFSLHRGENTNIDYWGHVRIYNIRGLKEYIEAFGFKVEKIKGAGYFPLPAILGDFDKTHCRFMTFKIKKIRPSSNLSRNFQGENIAK